MKYRVGWCCGDVSCVVDYCVCSLACLLFVCCLIVCLKYLSLANWPLT